MNDHGRADHDGGDATLTLLWQWMGQNGITIAEEVLKSPTSFALAVPFEPCQTDICIVSYSLDPHHNSTT